MPCTKECTMGSMMEMYMFHDGTCTSSLWKKGTDTSLPSENCLCYLLCQWCWLLGVSMGFSPSFRPTLPTSSGNVAPLLRHQMRGEALKGFGRNPKPYMDSNCSDRSVIELVVKPVYDWIWFDNLPTSSLEIEKNRATTIKAESHRWTTTCLHVFYDLFLQHAPGVPLTHHHPNRFHASTFWRQKLWLLGKLRHGWWNWPPKNSRIIGPLSQLRLWGTLDGDEECYVH